MKQKVARPQKKSMTHSQTHLVQILPGSTGCVTMSRLVSLSEVWFSRLLVGIIREPI